MNIYIGSDRIGFELKEKLIKVLSDGKNEIIDIGPLECKSVNYPEIAVQVASLVVNNPLSYGILICSSGIGMSIAANKVKGIRAANCTSSYLAEYSRLHNDANILCLGSSVVNLEDAISIMNIFLMTPFEGGGKHKERVQIINNIIK